MRNDFLVGTILFYNCICLLIDLVTYIYILGLNVRFLVGVAKTLSRGYDRERPSKRKMALGDRTPLGTRLQVILGGLFYHCSVQTCNLHSLTIKLQLCPKSTVHVGQLADSSN